MYNADLVNQLSVLTLTSSVGHELPCMQYAQQRFTFNFTHHHHHHHHHHHQHHHHHHQQQQQLHHHHHHHHHHHCSIKESKVNKSQQFDKEKIYNTMHKF